MKIAKIHFVEICYFLVDERVQFHAVSCDFMLFHENSQLFGYSNKTKQVADVQYG